MALLFACQHLLFPHILLRIALFFSGSLGWVDPPISRKGTHNPDLSPWTYLIPFGSDWFSEGARNRRQLGEWHVPSCWARSWEDVKCGAPAIISEMEGEPKLVDVEPTWMDKVTERCGWEGQVLGMLFGPLLAGSSFKVRGPGQGQLASNRSKAIKIERDKQGTFLYWPPGKWCVRVLSTLKG